jgi:carbon storage regulator CsrA
VLDVGGNTVKLGIDAPPELLILRGEIKVTNVNKNRPQTAVGDDDSYSVVEYLI